MSLAYPALSGRARFIDLSLVEHRTVVWFDDPEVGYIVIARPELEHKTAMRHSFVCIRVRTVPGKVVFDYEDIVLLDYSRIRPVERPVDHPLDHYSMSTSAGNESPYVRQKELIGLVHTRLRREPGYDWRGGNSRELKLLAQSVARAVVHKATVAGIFAEHEVMREYYQGLIKDTLYYAGPPLPARANGLADWLVGFLGQLTGDRESVWPSRRR